MHRNMAKLLFLCVVISVWIQGVSSTHLKLDNNGYFDFVLALSPASAFGLNNLSSISALMNEASKTLCHATKGQVFFRNVTVLLPGNWPGEQSAPVAELETFRDADVRVDVPSPLHGESPYTFQPRGCGQPGLYVHLTPAFLRNPARTAPSTTCLNDTTHSLIAKRFVREFAHLRYGVFDESGRPGSSLQPSFYLDDQRQLQPTGCPLSVQGAWLMPDNSPCVLDPLTRLPPAWCRFQPNDNTTSSASIMSYDQLASVDSFCESNATDPGRRHNSESPSLHNRLCGGRGVWDVIMEHQDFKPQRSPLDCSCVHLNVSVVAKYDRRKKESKCGRDVVVILDASDDMKQSGGYFKQLQAAIRIVRDIAVNGTRVAVITYDSAARVRMNFTTLADQRTRNLTSNILLHMGTLGNQSSSSIGFAELRNVWPSDGGRVILFAGDSDGPFDSQLVGDLVQHSIAVHTVSFGHNGSSFLEKLSRETGGMFVYSSNSFETTAIASFLQSLQKDLNLCFDPPAVEMDTVLIRQEPSQEIVFSNSTQGALASFVFTSPQGQLFDVNLTKPDLTVVDASVCTSDPDFSIVRCQVNVTQVGPWQYSISSRNGTAPVVASVTLHPLDENDVIQLTSWLSSTKASAKQPTVIYAHLRQGYAPVVAADVNATVTTPTGRSDVITLFDNGRMGDNVEKDGVYSGEFSRYDQNGAYHVDVTAKGGTSTAVMTSLSNTSDSSSLNGAGPSTLTLLTTGLFSRFTSPGSFVLSDMPEPGVDQMPPGRITDLQVVSSDCENGTATLNWTSAGDDGFSGTVSHYDIWMNVNSSILREHFNSSVNVSIVRGASPLPATEEQQVEITLPRPWPGQAYVIGVSAVDDNGLMSPLSNLVVIPCVPAQIASGTTAQTSISTHTLTMPTEPAAIAAASAAATATTTSSGTSVQIAAGLSTSSTEISTHTQEMTETTTSTSTSTPIMTTNPGFNGKTRTTSAAARATTTSSEVSVATATVSSTPSIETSTDTEGKIETTPTLTSTPTMTTEPGFTGTTSAAATATTTSPEILVDPAHMYVSSTPSIETSTDAEGKIETTPTLTSTPTVLTQPGFSGTTRTTSAAATATTTGSSINTAAGSSTPNIELSTNTEEVTGTTPMLTLTPTMTTKPGNTEAMRISVAIAAKTTSSTETSVQPKAESSAPSTETSTHTEEVLVTATATLTTDGPSLAPEKTATNAGSSTGGLSPGAVAGIACGVVAVLSAVAGIVIYFSLKSRTKGNAVHPDPFQPAPNSPKVPSSVPPKVHLELDVQ